MVPTPTRRHMPWLLSSLFTFVLAAQSQAQAPAIPRPDPLDPKAQVPSVRYESTLAQIRRIGDDKPMAWREANDAVARIGGWRVYAREAQQPDPAAAEKQAAPVLAPAPARAPASAPAATPIPSGPSGHKH